MNEKKTAKGAAAIDAMLAGGKKADTVSTQTPVTPVNPAADLRAEGIEVSDIIWKPLNWFRENPENELFRSMKSDAYFDALKRDISEAGAILNPLLAMPDGLLLEGESRLRISKELLQAGDDRFAKIPVMVVQSALSVEDQQKRLILGNISRFEIDEDTRLALYARIWPNYFLGSQTGRPKADDESAATSAEIAEKTGKSERQVRRDKAIVKAAQETAQTEGRAAPSPEDISKARREANVDRRESKAARKSPEPVKTEPERAVPADAIEPEADWDEPESAFNPEQDRWNVICASIKHELGISPENEASDWSKGAIAALAAAGKYFVQ